MKRIWLLPILLAAYLPLSVNPQSSRTLVIRQITVIDATGAQPKPKMTIVISGDRITALGEDGRIAVPKGAQIVDGRGKFLIPGLWDMHVHLAMAKETALPLLIANGVTSVRDMGGEFAVIQAMRAKVTSGALLGPRIKAAGPILESPRFIQVIERLTGVSRARERIGVANAEDAKRTVDSLAKMGVDFLKIRTNASRESYLAIAAEAKRAGLPLVGHAPQGLSLIEAAEAGQRSFEHLPVHLGNSRLENADLKEVSQILIKNGVRMVPTMVAGRSRLLPENLVLDAVEDKRGERDPRRKYVSHELAESWRKGVHLNKFENPPIDWKSVNQGGIERLRVMHRTGLKIMAGTDLAAPLLYAGSSLHEELELLVKEAGLSPMGALQSATRNPAEFFNLQDSLGTVERGKIADLVLLDADPLADIRNTQKIHAVILGGRLILKAETQKMLDQIAADVFAAALADERRVIKLDPKIYDAYVGEYEAAPNVIATVTIEGERLMTQQTGQPKIELFPESETQFFPKVVNAKVTFIKDESGQVTHLNVHMNGRDIKAKKIK